MFSNLWVTHLVCMRFDFIMIVPFLPFFCSFFVFGHRASFFGEFWHPPVDGCSTASCSFGVLEGRDEHASLPHHLEPETCHILSKKKKSNKNPSVFLFEIWEEFGEQ